ncbi:8-oxo-dGTP diphosphatase [Streptomyces umbrinus]|uniref:8-oxo-dGTP diphosphatase n=1 Tax=Streptomyces umbrinus TaxID=67370 RepID=A0ABU0SNZ5_9ACTN|nr:NUDIX hydrolase [Streptomyces umbrinus]MDQ1025273.1 8-oxo-dGTP diphosphatase [Streptomyces umbrinus]
MDMEIPGDKRLAAAVVMHEGRVLLVRRSETERFLPLVWGVPCGKLEPGESPEDGVLRELKEETGLLGEVVRKVGESSFVSEYQGHEIKNWQDNFLVKPLSWHITLQKPDQRYVWLSPAELDSVDIDAYNLDIVRQALTSF